MKTFEVQTEIAAPPLTVWAVLTQDLPKTPEPFGILRFEGQIGQGERIKLWSEVAPDRAFALTVVDCVEAQDMVWRGGMPFGLFTGTRRFRLRAQEQGCQFHMREEFTGPMAGLITRSMPDLTPSFTKFAQALKAKAEAQ